MSAHDTAMHAPPTRPEDRLVLGHDIHDAKWMRWAGYYLRTLWWGVHDRNLFREVRTYCMFIGYPRSGHTIIGALLDAHPDMIICTGGRALELIRRGYTAPQLYAFLARRSEALARTNHQRGGYHYVVPNQWQGRARRLLVIGDKFGGEGLQLGNEPALFERLRKTVAVDIRFIHVVRNPFDAITSTKIKKTERRTTPEKRLKHLQGKAERFFVKAEQAQRSIEVVGRDRVFEMRHEDFIAEPRIHLARLCSFLGIDATDDYLDDCAGIVFPRARPSRHRLDWPPELIGYVDERISKFECFRGYSFSE